VLGEYLDIYGGNVYSAFSQENIQAVEYDPGLPLCWALDFNVDPMCSVICQIYEPKRHVLTMHYEHPPVVRVLDEIVLPDSRTVDATKEFIRRALLLDQDAARLTVNIYGDASGNSRNTSATRTDYELIREVFSEEHLFQIQMLQNKSNPGVRDRINTVNNLLTTAAGSHRLLIDPKCKELIRDLRQVKWKRDGSGNPTGDLDKSDHARTHASDALGYLIARQFGMFGTSGERPYLWY
jgi:hypothetical protein